MSTTLIETLKRLADYEDANDYTKTATDLRAAAARLDELERENARLREAVLRVHFELGEYIDANGGEVRVNVALAFEIARHAVETALAGSGEK
jgi:hypothetical protein